MECVSNDQDVGQFKLGATQFKIFLIFTALVPALYLFFAIQYGSITFPFWDHCELVRFFVKLYDGTLTFQDLWSPHNHTRPFFLRLIYIFNGWLTDWDVRSEYVYMYLAIYGAFAWQGSVLWKIAGSTFTVKFCTLFLLCSIFSFSPVGHNNHWWSMMLQLNLAYLFIVIGLTLGCFFPHQWRATLFAAAACIVATFTLTNGLFAMIAISVVAQLSAKRMYRINRFTAFWVLSILLISLVYFPGLPENPSSVARPGPVEILRFVVVYVGSPIGGLLRFPYQDQFFIPRPTVFNGFVGVLFLCLICGLLFFGRKEVRVEESKGYRILLGSFVFTILSAVATAMGRAAFDDYGVSNANSSRYSLMSSVLIMGTLFYFADYLTKREKNKSSSYQTFSLPKLKWVTTGMLITFVVLAANSYGRALSIYQQIHGFNELLADAYYKESPNIEENSIYPRTDFVVWMKKELKRLKIGPYRQGSIGKVPWAARSSGA